jgi:hypothetical protein
LSKNNSRDGEHQCSKFDSSFSNSHFAISCTLRPNASNTNRCSSFGPYDKYIAPFEADIHGIPRHGSLLPFFNQTKREMVL